MTERFKIHITSDDAVVVDAEDATAAGREVARIVGRAGDVVATTPIDAPYDPSAEF
jgi:hypothetical protein